MRVLPVNIYRMTELARRLLDITQARKTRELLITQPCIIVPCLLCECVTYSASIPKTSYLIRGNKVQYLCQTCRSHVNCLASLP